MATVHVCLFAGLAELLLYDLCLFVPNFSPYSSSEVIKHLNYVKLVRTSMILGVILVITFWDDFFDLAFL